ncbi:MAG: outer membrane lipoprotein carrier protein LolA [Nitratireductor sp.]
MLISNLIVKNIKSAFSALALVLAVSTFANANEREDTIRALSDHYAKVPTMSGEFLQFGPKGQQNGGTFYLARPGKIRFEYEEPSPIEVVSNGLSVAVLNKQLKTFQSYPLKKTPLKLLLDNKISVKNNSIKSVKVEEDVTTIVMGDKQLFGNSVITLLFDPKTFDLRQWTIKDAQGKETSVLIFDVQKNVKLSNRLFQFSKVKYKRK